VIRYVTASEVAFLYRRPIGTVYRLASVHRWRRIDGRPTLYAVADVIATFRTTLAA
jgi:hypothetical protein